MFIAGAFYEYCAPLGAHVTYRSCGATSGFWFKAINMLLLRSRQDMNHGLTNQRHTLRFS